MIRHQDEGVQGICPCITVVYKRRNEEIADLGGDEKSAALPSAGGNEIGAGRTVMALGDRHNLSG